MAIWEEMSYNQYISLSNTDRFTYEYEDDYDE